MERGWGRQTDIMRERETDFINSVLIIRRFTYQKKKKKICLHP